MSILQQLSRLVEDPPPPFAFEFSQAGISFAARAAGWHVDFRPIDPDVLMVAPTADNVRRPEVLEREIRTLAPPNGSKKRREAVVILPDYAVRVAVLTFESFPNDKEEQASLVRFRLKKTLPFELDQAVVSYSARNDGGRHEVVAAAAALEVVARYEAPVRAAGLHPGFVTTSTLAALDLLLDEGLVVFAKMADRALTVAVTDGPRLKLLRCLELPEVSVDEVMGILFPTVAFAEDELPSRPAKLLECGFGEMSPALAEACASELNLTVAPLRSRLGVPNETNAGLFGYLQANAER